MMMTNERLPRACRVAALLNKKKLVTRRCVSFVDRFIAAFCCSLWTSCRRTGSQSSCASNHRKLVDKAACLVVGRHGRRASDAIVVLHIVFTMWYGHSLYYLLPFVSCSRISRLESSVRTARLLFPAYIRYVHCTLDRYLPCVYVTMNSVSAHGSKCMLFLLLNINIHYHEYMNLCMAPG